jgi:hypothetical protein
MEFKSAQHGAPESKWKWKDIKHTNLTPLTTCHGNKDYPWIIISGKQEVGRYCKAISCPMLLEDAETSDIWFTVALAQVELQGGKPVTVLDLLREERQIRQGDLAVVFRTQAEQKEEPLVYEGVRAMARKKRKAEDEYGEANLRTDSGDTQGSTAKKSRIDDVEVVNEEVASAVKEVILQDVATGSQ